MNKTLLIEVIAKETKFSKSVCKDVLETFVKTIEQSLKKGKAVVFTGFGTFDVAKRKERIGVNPATRAKMKIPAKKVPKFRPGKQLKEAII